MKYLTTVSLIILLKTSAMALEIKTEIEIKASPEKVWSVFSKFEEYPNWNPFILSLTGDVKEGSKIEAMIKASDSKPMTFKPKVLTLVKNKELSWLGHLLMPGIFDGKHKFELINNGDGTTTFIQSEEFKGFLVSLFKKQLNEKTKNGFLEMNLKLKELAEKN